jgi:hypothetical protein
MPRRKGADGDGGTAADNARGEAVETQDADDKQQPVHTVRLRNVRAAVWANRNDGGTYYTVTFSRSYRDQEGNWHTTESFGRDDLLLLAKVADVAHTWIWNELQPNVPAETSF